MSDLPSGIVTFLFTDIEGSTRLVERLGDRYADVQSRHDAILRAAIGAGEGREVSTAGDSFFAVFATPAGAVRAAMAAQRELAATSWPDGLAVRVRMGLHSGDGTPHDDDYIGLDVNRAARIAAAAHGGQVLLSDATRVLVEHDLPPDSRLLDLGRHRLKDLLQPERLHQLLMVGLEQDFPPLRTLEARQNNLPAQLTRFIGRHDEVRQLRDRLTRARLVTLTGPGGTGKTRLALQVAAEALSDFEDGVVFVDLSALIEPDLVADEIAGAMNLRAEPGRSTRETLEDHLRDKSLLLVLDNFEQVAEAAHSTLEPLLRAAHRVTALATSRVPLHVQGEQRHAVAPLAVPATGQADDRDAMAQVEAVMLFCDRAAAVRPGFRLTPENARAVAAIVERLDGLPLALELAASRLNILSIEDLLARLDDRLALLSARDRSLPERQRTLRQTIQWSHDLLDEREQGLFRRLSVFAGGVALDAATAVVDPEAGGGSDILDALDSLVEKNLLRPAHDIEDESRFVMLETIREFGLERLAEAGEEDEIRRWHAEHWYAVAARLAAAPAVEQPASARLLGRDQENIRAALGWAIRSGDAELGLRLGAALRDFWRVSGHVREGLDWLERLLSLAGAQAKTHLRARALTAAADLSGWTGEADGYLRLAEEAVSIYRELDDPRGLADALEEIGMALFGSGRFDEAPRALTEARERNVALGNRQKAAECTLALGVLALAQGMADEAHDRFTEAHAAFADLGDWYWIAFAERLLGGAARLRGDIGAAAAHYATSLALSRRHDLPVLTAGALYSFAELALAGGDHERALRLMGASEVIRDRVGEAPAGEVAMMGDVRGAAAAFFDEPTSQRLFRQGREMDLDAAVAYALEDRRDL